MARQQKARPRQVGIFGGSFDPIHLGHLAVARAAIRKFKLDELHLVVAGQHPFPEKRNQTSFVHRYAMVALACSGEKRLIPSLAEAGPDGFGRQVCYSVDTVRYFREQVLGPADRLFFLTGADAFLELPKWKAAEELLALCNFIVVSRPGFNLRRICAAIPRKLLGRATALGRVIRLPETHIALMEDVRVPISSTEIRRRCRAGKPIRGLVPASVENYILQQALYR